MSAGIVRHASTEKSVIIAIGVECAEILPTGPYAENMSVYSYKLASGANAEITDELQDQYLYIQEGEVEVQIDGKSAKLKEAGAAFAKAGEKISITGTFDSAVVLNTKVPSPKTPWAASIQKSGSGTREYFTHIGAKSNEAATGSREFEVLFNSDNGSTGATMFVGFIPSSGAPSHYHLYDEACVIVSGKGALVTPNHGEQALKKGSAFHVSNRYLHAIHNPNPEDLWILGIFRPEGTAAAAFYPDGTPAPVSK